MRRTWLTAFEATASPVSFAMKSGLTLHGMRLPAWMSGLCRAVCIALLLNSARQHRRIVGLADHDLRLRPLLSQHARHAFQRSAGAESRHPVIEPFALKSFRISCAVGGSACRHSLRSKLACVVPAVLFGQFHCLVDHAHRAGRSRGHNHLGAEKRISLRRSMLNVSAMVTTRG